MIIGLITADDGPMTVAFTVVLATLTTKADSPAQALTDAVDAQTEPKAT